MNGLKEHLEMGILTLRLLSMSVWVCILFKVWMIVWGFNV
jgi:hypothetical protein